MDNLWQSEQRVAAKSFSESKRSFSLLSSDMATMTTDNTFTGMGRQGRICLPQCAHFPVKIADCDLKYCILKEKAKNSISGSNFFKNVFTNSGRETSLNDNLRNFYHPPFKKFCPPRLTPSTHR
jgi:hypothetical protein